MGTDWMMHTMPWAKLMGNLQWPADIKPRIKDKKNKLQIDTVQHTVCEEDTSDEDMSDVDESEADHIDLSLWDVDFEEDEVDQLLYMMG